MKLTPEQIAEGWIAWPGGECPIKDAQPRIFVMYKGCGVSGPYENAAGLRWSRYGWPGDIIAYRIDATPSRPTPYPASYDDLVFDDETDMSQIIVLDDGMPKWLRPDDLYQAGHGGRCYRVDQYSRTVFGIRIKRREPKRETVDARLEWKKPNGSAERVCATIDLIDGKPDLSTLKIGEEA